jgi:nucleotide-binding universal stress UspA family protein
VKAAFAERSLAMLPIHTILHPTDFSDRSEHAFRVACALARDYDARLVVLHVDNLPLALYGDALAMPRPDDYQDRLREQLNDLRAPGVEVEHRLNEGNPVTEILGAAEEVNADLVVMGTHGRTGLGRLLMGSVAEQVLRQAPCPVLTVRAPFPELVAAAGPAAEAARV